MNEERRAELTPAVTKHILSLFGYAGLQAIFNENDRLTFLGGKTVTPFDELSVEITPPTFAIFAEDRGWIASMDNSAQQLPPINASFKEEIKYDDRESISGVFDTPLAAALFISQTYLDWEMLGLYDSETA